MPARKRARAEMEEPSPAASSSHLDLLRNMWQFANLVQFLSFFGEAIGANVNLSIEVSF